MKVLCGDEAYSQPYMKQKVQEHYGTSILITELNGKVTFRQCASTIIHNYYKESKLDKSYEDSKLFLIKTAAALIKTEIRSMPVDKNFYPSNNDILSHEKHIPESLTASRQGRTPVITFDQPLYWKSVMITSGEECSNIIVRLGAFHTEMSLLGSIGRIMSGSGLKEVLELIYAPNAVTHMLYGKAVSRAVRGFMLVDTALHTLMTNEIFGHDIFRIT
ncbi:unnamed protein product [Mytilus coruscus]|uniref:Uncharacterized protein n=1 Tax=Mytilus coruscus TaxID=42192 RepID=A0A6J8ALQ2_MYTCO|nr:unnamed protein product [Mytilus coruscus]